MVLAEEFFPLSHHLRFGARNANLGHTTKHLEYESEQLPTSRETLTLIPNVAQVQNDQECDHDGRNAERQKRQGRVIEEQKGEIYQREDRRNERHQD